MQSPLVRFRLADGSLRAVAPPGLVGRTPGAALRLDDPRISETHAWVSLRDGELLLLALRGAVEVGGARVAQVPLRPGQVVRLAEGIDLVVDAVVLPSEVSVLVLPGGRRRPLFGEIVSIVRADPLEAVARFDADARARLWPVGSGWRYALAGQKPRDLGDALVIDGLAVQVEQVPLGQVAVPKTAVEPALLLVPTFTEVRIVVEGRAPLLLHGHAARIVSELCEYAEPVEWVVVASALWPDDHDRVRLRTNWDRNLRLLRQKLREAGLREDLVDSDGHGNIALRLRPRDAVDRSTLR